VTRFQKFAAWCERDDYNLFWPNLLYWVCVTGADVVSEVAYKARRALASSLKEKE
jgi:hypothetical protein